ECRAPRIQDRGGIKSYKQGSKEEESTPRALMAIDGIGWDWSYMANEEENHALVADEEAPTEFPLMAKSSSSSKNQRTDKNMERLGYSVVPPPAQVYSPPKKDMSWTELPEFVDDTITDYSRPFPSIASNTSDLQNSNSSVSEHGESSKSIMSKPMIKFVKACDSPKIIKTNKVKTARKSFVRYAKMYRNTSKSPNVRGNQRNWNNLKSQQLGKDFLIKNKACFKCGHFDHLAYDYGLWVEKGKKWPKNNFTHKIVTPRAILLKTGRTPIAVNRTNINVA
nr:ubiquitin hydrolase [Tanacetum cinerariifolium]